MKGQIPMLEMIAVVIALFVAFSIFFPAAAYKNRWSDATLILKGRDVILTADRIEKLNNYAFDSKALENFLSKVISEKNLISWSLVEGTAQAEITVACNCTTEQIRDLISWISRLKLNERRIEVNVIPTTLSPIQKSEVLFIWGNKDLTNFKTSLIDYLKGGNGIVQMADVNRPSDVQKEIFGIADCSEALPNCGGGGGPDDDFIKPTNSTQSTYQAYKFFHHLPVNVRATVPTFFVPIEDDLEPCLSLPAWEGDFSFRKDSYKFWTCGTSVYFDTNKNRQADKILKELDKFQISGYNFVMSYVELNRTFISFKPIYQFNDFRDGATKLFPADNDASKILLHNGFYAASNNPIPVVVTNGSAAARTAWLSDLTKNGVSDDEKLLLASLIVSSSNKKSQEPFLGNLRIGFLTSYVNSVNRDMFEIYQFSLGLGFPF